MDDWRAAPLGELTTSGLPAGFAPLFLFSLCSPLPFSSALQFLAVPLQVLFPSGHLGLSLCESASFVRE